MKLTALGHSSFLLEMANDDGELVRVLGDPWLTDYVIGDAMGRMPRIRVGDADWPQIHGIYLSHSHTDHLDPYSLVPLWQQLDPKPQILLPQSIAYLAPLLAEFLPGAECLVLNELEALDCHGLSVRGLFNLEELGTNEDDVMMLCVESAHELFLAEADAVFPYADPVARDAMTSLLRPELNSVGVLAIKNELHTLMASVHARSVEQREELVNEAITSSLDEIESMYVGLDELEQDLWDDPRVTRFIGGQGICFPQRVDPRWNRVLFPYPLEARAEHERNSAEAYGREVHVSAFRPGWTFETQVGAPTASPTSWVELLDQEQDIEFEADLELFEEFPDAPLVCRPLDPDTFEPCLLQALNERFLPWLIGRRQPPIEHLLSHYEGEYRIRVRHVADGKDPSGFHEKDYRITFDELRFQPCSAAGEAQEVYWALDLDDYFEGRCDDFTTFARRQPGGEARHFWDCLGMPYLNNDLVQKKLRYHFERAQAGRTVEEFVLPFYKGLEAD